MQEVAPGIYCIDCDYVQPRLACAYIVLSHGQVAFVETNTSLAVPRLLEGLSLLGLANEDVQYIIPTHVHLDHAGGAGALLQACSQATVLAHPKAARHLINPIRLIQSSREVYGEELFANLYGEIVPCEEDRVRIMEDEEILDFGQRRFRFLHTRGHANHHFCIFEETSNGLFSGDSFGIAYPDLQENRRFIFASSTPTDFDPDAAHETVDRLVRTGADRIYLTHFGRLDLVKEAAQDLHSSLDFLSGLLAEAVQNGTQSDTDLAGQSMEDELQRRILNSWLDELEKQGKKDRSRLAERLKMDAALNAGGLMVAAQKALKSR
ncbi:MAG: MBL fold metallo-hydrolase [Leptospiraceae bacterium]|nr:MBL fold metallo-hydrolase [Leptospiraceae bacterium]